MCRSTSKLNKVTSVLLVLTVLACALSFVAPFWILFSKGTPSLSSSTSSSSPLSISGSLLLPPKGMRDSGVTAPNTTSPAMVKWIGLWAECYQEQGVKCKWFWQDGFDWQNSLKDWYKATQAIYGIGLGLLFISFILQCVYMCCRCCLETSCCLTTTTASFIIAGSLLCGLSLGLYGGFSLYDDVLSPVANGGKGGTLDWAIFVGMGGAGLGVIVSVLYYVDGCIQARNYRGYKAPILRS